MMVEEYRHMPNNGEGFTLNGKRIQCMDDYSECKYYVTFTYSDEYGLYSDDDFYAVHRNLHRDFAKELMSDCFPDSDPDHVFKFFEDLDCEEKIIDGIIYNTLHTDAEGWKSLYASYAREKLKPSFNNIHQFQKFIVPVIKKYIGTINTVGFNSIDGRVFLLGGNTAVLTFWWAHSISPGSVFKIVSSLKEVSPRLENADFYIALAHKIVPVEEFTGDFEPNDNDKEQIEKQKEIHLANYEDKRKALNPYLRDRTRHQGKKLQMSNGDEMTQAEYNSYLHQESIKRMVKGVILEYLNLKTKLVIR